jgi:hypothetical protein
MDGAPDVLRAASLWNEGKDGKLEVKHGDSFVMLVGWDPQGRVHSRSIQPFGAATTRPASPHYADQAALFVPARVEAGLVQPRRAARQCGARLSPVTGLARVRGGPN